MKIKKLRKEIEKRNLDEEYDKHILKNGFI